MPWDASGFVGEYSAASMLDKPDVAVLMITHEHEAEHGAYGDK